MSANAVGPKTDMLESEDADTRSIGIEAAFIAACAIEATQIE